MIQKWKIKAVVQKVISFFPYKEHLNYFFQRFVTKGNHLTDEYFQFKLNHALQHVKYLQTYGKPSPTNKILELGTGWYPIIPIGYFLQDLGTVYSVDLYNWLTKKSFLLTIQKILKWKELNKVNSFLPLLKPERWAILQHINDHPSQYTKERIAKAIGLIYLVEDARKLPIEDRSVDFICSNNTYEHIPSKTLRAILDEFKRVLIKEGVMSHFIDMTDHFAHIDKSLTLFNFLQYSEKKWNLIDNAIQPQNRMRLKDYHTLYSSLSIPITTSKTNSGRIEDLRKLSLHPDFEKYTEEELAICHAYVVSLC
ncbi:MAG: class I SAM-dependent methyltransferase [Cyclobacteriaceae bacterium]